MCIIRVAPREQFTIIPNATIRDDRLSLDALGLLARLLSRPDSWEVRPDAIQRECKIGRDATRKLLAQLTHAGYLTREKLRMFNKETGRWQWVWVSILRDRPVSVSMDGFSGHGKSGHGKSGHGKSGHISSNEAVNKDRTNTNTSNPPLEEGEMLLLSSVQSETNTPSLQPQEETEQLFEQAWRAYPPRCGANPRAAALRAWCARIREGVAPAAMLAGVKRYREWADSCKKTNTQWVMTAGKFFGPDHLFEDHWALPSQPEQGLETGGRIGRLIAEEMNERRRRSLQEGGAA